MLVGTAMLGLDDAVTEAEAGLINLATAVLI